MKLGGWSRHSLRRWNCRFISILIFLYFFLRSYIQFKRRKRNKESSLQLKQTQIVCAKGGLTKGTENKIIFGWFVAMVTTPCASGMTHLFIAEGISFWVVRGISTLLSLIWWKPPLSLEVTAPQRPWQTIWELKLCCPQSACLLLPKQIFMTWRRKL